MFQLSQSHLQAVTYKGLNIHLAMPEKCEILWICRMTVKNIFLTHWHTSFLNMAYPFFKDGAPINTNFVHLYFIYAN